MTGNTQENSGLGELISSTKFTCVCGATLLCSEYNTHAEECTDIQAANEDLMERTKVRQAIQIVNRSTFHCPLCSERNMDRSALLQHFESSHQGTAGVCPVCAVMPWGDPNYVSRDLFGHMRLRHKFDYDTYTDFAEQEEEMLRKVMEDSLNQQ